MGSRRKPQQLTQTMDDETVTEPHSGHMKYDECFMKASYTPDMFLFHSFHAAICMRAIILGKGRRNENHRSCRKLDP